MSKTILVVGYGPGISNAVAEKFGAAGFSVGLVARNEARLAEGVKTLGAKGIKAAAFPADASNPASIRAAVAKARSALGPITVIEWTAYSAEAGDLATAGPDAVRDVFDVAIVGLLAAVQEALPDMKNSKEGAVLVTNGTFADVNPQSDGLAVSMHAMGLAVASAAKHKLVGLLSERLKKDDVFVGEMMVPRPVKGTAFDQGNATIEAADVAKKFWDLYQDRSEIRGHISAP